MLKINKVHHIAVICSNYIRSKDFYTRVLGFKVLHEVFRENRDSMKADLALNGEYMLELFSFPQPPERVSQPEATGLRHIAFQVDLLSATLQQLTLLGVFFEPVRTDAYTGKKFTFILDPDGLPIELYEK